MKARARVILTIDGFVRIPTADIDPDDDDAMWEHVQDYIHDNMEITELMGIDIKSVCIEEIEDYTLEG